jgi:uncharacterized protein YegL
MVGEPIEAVKDGVQKLLSSLRRDPYALECVHISLITFGRKADVLIPLAELSEFHCPEIKLSDNAECNLGSGLQLLLSRYDEEVERTTTDADEKGDWLPLIVLMTSGELSDAEYFETTIPRFDEYPFAKKIVCVTGVDKFAQIFRSFTKDIFLLDTMGSHSFSRFWQWVSTIVGVQSQSLGQFQEELPLPHPEINLFYPELNPFYNDTNIVESAEQSISTPILPPPPPPTPTPNIHLTLENSVFVSQ